MPRLFSYVVDHDYGYAPHPFGRYCTLAKCKYGSGRFENVVELAEVGDWIAGTGSVDLTKNPRCQAPSRLDRQRGATGPALRAGRTPRPRPRRYCVA